MVLVQGIHAVGSSRGEIHFATFKTRLVFASSRLLLLVDSPITQYRQMISCIP